VGLHLSSEHLPPSLLHDFVAIKMIVTLELDLHEELASEAASSGLLESRTISNLLIEEIRRRKSAAELKSILTGIRNQPGDIPNEDEINAEVEQARTLRRV